MNRPALLLVCAAVAIAGQGACGGSQAHVEDSRLVGLPRSDRQQLIDQQREVDVARANLNASQAALDQAHQFREVVEGQADAANESVDATAQALNLARSTRSDNQDQAADAHTLAAQRLQATQAKKGYADALIQLREAELQQRKAALNVAQARYEHAKFESLQSANMQGALDASEFEDALRDAQAQRSEAQGQVSDARQQMESAKDRWQGALSRYQQTDQRIEDKVLHAPPPAKYLEQRQAKPADAEQLDQPGEGSQ